MESQIVNKLISSISTRSVLRVIMIVYSRKIDVSYPSKLKFLKVLVCELISTPKQSKPYRFDKIYDEESSCNYYSFYTVENQIPFLNLSVEVNDINVNINIVPF